MKEQTLRFGEPFEGTVMHEDPEQGALHIEVQNPESQYTAFVRWACAEGVSVDTHPVVAFCVKLGRPDLKFHLVCWRMDRYAEMMEIRGGPHTFWSIFPTLKVEYQPTTDWQLVIMDGSKFPNPNFDGNWTEPVEVTMSHWTNEAPRPSMSGRLFAGAGPRIGRTDNPNGFDIQIVGPSNEQIQDARNRGAALLTEGTWYQTDEGIIRLLMRSNAGYLWMSESYDNGYFFDKMYIVRDEVYEQKVPGWAKGGQYGYPEVCIKGDYMYVAYSRMKEVMGVTRIKLSDI